MTENDRFTIGFYFQTLTGILGAPSHFFNELSEEVGFRQPFGFLMISSLFFMVASLTHIREKTVLMAGILFVNAVAMPFILSGIGFMVMTMTMGKRVAFLKFFAVYAFAAGVTMLASWIPLFFWFTEPWKWMLIALGLVKGCGLKWKQAGLIIVLSIFVTVLSFWSFAPATFYTNKLTG
ncbi:MAG: hypothetical protein ISS66_06420 [Desulfobacteraceae bacterium]|nr:hypothetical protein [Desulfobacteraceae bacterium]